MLRSEHLWEGKWQPTSAVAGEYTGSFGNEVILTHDEIADDEADAGSRASPDFSAVLHGSSGTPTPLEEGDEGEDSDEGGDASEKDVQEKLLDLVYHCTEVPLDDAREPASMAEIVFLP